MTKFTVLGASGFIGSRLVRKLAGDGFGVDTPARGDELSGDDLGHVAYCIGVTADFRTRLPETVEAHVCHLADVLRESRFESFTYLSSTRVYQGGSSPAAETDPLSIRPADPDHLYNISKALGEAMVLAAHPRTHVLRLSNVYGLDLDSQNFLGSVIRTAVKDGHVDLGTSLHSAKDYVSLDDVVELIVEIVVEGQHGIYNVAAGTNTTNRDILDTLMRATGCTLSVSETARTVVSPVIDVARITREFGFKPRSVLEDLPALVTEYAERVVQR